MFDNLFNRKKAEDNRIPILEEQIKTLKSRINELELENGSLSMRLSKKDMLTKKALSDKQEADAALNKAYERLKNLEYELKNTKKQNADELTFKNSVTLTNDKSMDLLFQIGSIRSKNENLLTIYLAPGDSLADLYEFERTVNLNKDTTSLVQKIKSPTGTAIFYDMNKSGMSPLIAAAAAPPFPIDESKWMLNSAFDIEQLQEILNFEVVIAIVFAHAGETFIGVANKEKIIDYRIVRSSVKGKHKKGGWSQKRFERLIAEDVRNHVEKAREVFEEIMKEYKDKFDIKVIVGAGEQNLVKEITEGCECEILFKGLNVKIEKHNVDKIRVGVWSSRWYELV